MKTVWKKLWPELVEYKGILITVFILGAAIGALKNTVPFLMDALVETAWKGHDETLAIQIPIAIALVWTVSGILRYFNVFWMRYTSDRIAVKLRRDLMNKYLSLNLSFYQQFVRGSGGLISRMVHDISIVQANLPKVADFIREPIVTLFALGVLIYIDWKLVIFVGVALPLVTFVSRKFALSIRKYGFRNQEAMEDLTNTLKESLDGTRVVQSFNLEDEMRQRFNRQADSYLLNLRKIVSREEASSPISESLASFAIASILVYLGFRTFSGEFTMGNFAAFLTAITLLQDSVKKIQYAYIKLQQTSVALERVHHIFDSAETVPEVSDPKPFPKDWETIEYKNVGFSFDHEPVLKNVNLTVKRGEIIALVGASGGGKSTLVNLLERFYDPNEGQIDIGGTSIGDMQLKDLRRHIALVTQDVFLFGDSIERNIQLGSPEDGSQDVKAAAQAANADKFINKMKDGYNSRVGERGSFLSGGEKQRISIARAIYKDAPILILDEATSALDTESELEVQKGLDKLMTGRTAFVIAHRLSTIVNADRILVLKNGEVVEEGNHQDLLARKGEYFRYHSLQQK